MEISVEQTIEMISRLPVDLQRFTDKSSYQLVQESGYVENKKSISTELIGSFVKLNKPLINEWLLYSENQRSTPSWVFEKNATGYRTYFLNREGSQSKAKKYLGGTEEACAGYIFRVIEQIAK